MATIAGARGEGTLTWLSSWPFEVLTKMRSPQDTGLELARLWGDEPTSAIMSNRQTTSASVSAGELLVRDGPVVLPVAEALRVDAHELARGC